MVRSYKQSNLFTPASRREIEVLRELLLPLLMAERQTDLAAQLQNLQLEFL